MPIQLSNRNGTQIYHREDKNTFRFSIFGSNNVMDYGYVNIEDTARNNKGLYTEPTIEPEHIQDGIIQLNNKAPAPVWTLAAQYDNTVTPPLHQEQQTNNNQSVTNTLASKKFVWPYGGKSVYLTGTFDDWKASIPMTPVNTNENVFEVTVDNLDLSRDNTYKFIVDGEWCYDVKKDFTVDASGIVNNIIYATKN